MIMTRIIKYLQNTLAPCVILLALIASGNANVNAGNKMIGTYSI